MKNTRQLGRQTSDGISEYEWLLSRPNRNIYHIAAINKEMTARKEKH